MSGPLLHFYLKTVDFESNLGQAFSSFTGDQTVLQWTTALIVSIIGNPRAWSKTMGIASSI